MVKFWNIYLDLLGLFAFTSVMMIAVIDYQDVFVLEKK